MPTMLIAEAETAAGSVLEKGIEQTSGVLTLMSNVADFVVNNELCLLFLGFMFVSRAVGVLRKCLRVTPR